MGIAYFSAVYLVVANVLVGLFQVALAAGAPMGEYAWGGRESGRLSAKLRVSSAFSALLLFAIAGHYASVIGWLPSMLDAHTRAFSLWGLTALYALSTLGNYKSKSEQERKMFLPVSGSMLLANILILVFYRLG